MTVEQLEVIDFVSMNKEKTRAYLTISDHLDWNGDGDEEDHHLYSRHEKIQNYLNFIESGQLAKYRSEAADLPVTIHVRAKYPVRGKGVKFYETANKVVADAGFTLESEHVPSKQDKPA